MLIRCPRARRWPEGGGKDRYMAAWFGKEAGVKKVIPIVADPCIFRNRSV